jgi:hypothetical protein
MLALPVEADAILIINPDAELAPSFTSQALETISRRHRQLTYLTHSIDLIELPPSHGPQLTRAHPAGCQPVRAIENRLSAWIPEGPYHASHYIEYRCKCQARLLPT